MHILTTLTRVDQIILQDRVDRIILQDQVDRMITITDLAMDLAHRIVDRGRMTIMMDLMII